MEQRPRRITRVGGVGYSFSRRGSRSGWGKSPSSGHMGFEEGAVVATTPPSYFCAMHGQNEHKSGSTCGTSSPSPRVRGAPAADLITNSSSPPPAEYDSDRSEQQQQQQQRHGSVVISEGSDSTSAISYPILAGPFSESSASTATTPPPPRRRVVWAEFDSTATPLGGRELARRQVTFKIFVVFRGGWCTSSHALLKGEFLAWCLLCRLLKRKLNKQKGKERTAVRRVCYLRYLYIQEITFHQLI